MLFEWSLLRACISIHGAAVLRPLWSAVIGVLELALMSARLIDPRAFRPARLVGRCRLPAGEVGVLREGGARLAWGVRGSLGLGCVLP